MVATNAINEKDLDLNSSSDQSKIKLKLLCIRSLFIFSWLTFSTLIFLVVVLADINWTRPSLEEIIGHSVHRNVKLGRLSWNFGWHGFSVNTSKLLVAERSGEPFLMAGNCEIGFSFTSLLAGVGKIHYINMQKPLFMAIHTGPKTWNFDDLLTISPDIDFIQIREGHVFVVDRQTNNHQSFPDTELNDVTVKFQRGNNFVPAQFKLVFKLPQNSGGSAFNLSSKIWDGGKEQWWKRKCHLELSANRFTVANWQTIKSLTTVDSKDAAYSAFLSKLISGVPRINNSDNSAHVILPSAGFFDFNLVANGIPDKKLGADVKLKADSLSLCAARTNKCIDLPETSISGQAELSPDNFVWNRCVVKIPDYKLILSTTGSNFADINNKQYSRQWSLTALAEDLKRLNPLLVFINNNISTDTKFDNKKLFSNLAGRLFLDLECHHKKEGDEYVVLAKAKHVNIDGIKPFLNSVYKIAMNKTEATNPLNGKKSQLLALSRQSEFSGTIIGHSQDGLILQDCFLDDNGMSWKISGRLDHDGVWHQLLITSKDLDLEKLSNQLSKNSDLAHSAKTILGLNNNSELHLAGHAQITAKLDTYDTKLPGKTNPFICEIKFQNSDLKTSEPNLAIRHLEGQYTSSQDKLICKNLRFLSGSGQITIDALMSANKKDNLRYKLQGKNLSVYDLRQTLSLFHIETTFLDSWNLSGKLSNIDLSIGGTNAKPNFSMVASPADLVFMPQGLKQSIHASGGRLSFDHNSLLLDKVTLAGSNSKCLISGAFKISNTSAKVARLNLQLNNVDLDDLQNYLTLAHVPSSQLIKKYQLSNLKGSVSGPLEYLAGTDKSRLNGIILFDGISFKWGAQRLFCKNIKGKAILSDSDLVLHETTGNMGNSTLSLHGRLINYMNNTKDSFPQWNGEITAQVAPEDIDNIYSLMASKPSFDLQAKKSVFVKLRQTNHVPSSSLSFTLVADPDAGLSLMSDNVTLYQPARKLTVNGSCFIDEQKINWRNLNFDFTGSSLNVQGSVSNYRNAKVSPTLDLKVQSSESMPAGYLGQMFSSGVINGAITGQAKVNIAIQGTAKAPSVSGKISLTDLSIPDVYLSHIIGSISLQPSQTGGIPSLLQLDKFFLGPVQLSKGSGALFFQNDFSQLSLKNFVAEVAQGKLNAEAQVESKTQKMHLNLNVNNASLAQLWPQVTSSQIKATGLVGCNLSLDTYGTSAKELEQNMTGAGHIHAIDGSFSRLSQLHAKLNQVNLIRQGIFGFNFNNVMQSVLPAKASEFDSIDSAFAIDKQVVTIRHIFYDGKDIKFSAAGKVNLALHTLDLDIAGLMPRVSNSVLGGKLGELSREITLQKLLDGVTMHKLEKLPSLPLIGGIAGGPEIFTCRIAAPYDQPKMISQSVEKSFKWLHNN